MIDSPRDVLVFALDEALYAVEAAQVREITWLPSLSPAPGGLVGCIGGFNLRGVVVRVVDLAVSLGQASHRCRATDQVVVLDLVVGPVGVVASEVRDLARLTADMLPAAPRLQHSSAGGLIAGSVQLGDALVTLLDVRFMGEGAGELPALAVPAPIEALPAQQAILRERTQTLQHMSVDQTFSDTTFAVVELSGQWFAVDLSTVREFCRVPQLRPIPCCPPHVAGVFSLRGQLLTLLEIGAALDLPPPAGARPRAIIVSRGLDALGVAVDDVIDVFNPEAEALKTLPASAGEARTSDIWAVASFAGRTVPVVDLSTLIGRERWTVDQIVT